MAKTCQSCGMPMSRDASGGGTETDGTTSQIYCSYCYQNGTFTQPDFSAVDMQKFCIEKMKEMGLPRPMGWLFSRQIPKLERWKS